MTGNLSKITKLIKKAFAALMVTGTILGLTTACEDENSTIGSSISRGEVEITIDTISFNLYGKAKAIESFDSKTGNLMLGRLQNESYGKLDCSFVTRLMCSANLGVDDSLFYTNRVDSCKLIMGAARGNVSGDSLVPQILSVYKLNKQLPSNIDNTFNPEGYYNPSTPFATFSYTLSELSSNDSTFNYNSYVDLTMDLPKEFGEEIFKAYKNEPEIFQWPQTMAERFLPGLYVKQDFGNGCVANIQSVFVGVFYHSLEEKTTVVDNDTTVSVVHVNHLAVPFTVSPEVLSSNNISYVPSQNIVNKNRENNGEIVITTPGGYIGEFTFPAAELLERYREKEEHLSTVNDLYLYIPAAPFDSESGIGIAQNLLIVKSSEYENFFKDNKIPDNLTSFTGVYDSANGWFVFSSMRNYFLNLLQQKEVTEEDMAFTIVPVEISTETVTGYYTEGSTYVTKCVPYTSKPTMTLLKTAEAHVNFSFSTQIID